MHGTFSTRYAIAELAHLALPFRVIAAIPSERHNAEMDAGQQRHLARHGRASRRQCPAPSPEPDFPLPAKGGAGA